MVITDVNQVVYQGNGSNTSFPFTFRIIDATDIKLLLIDADGTEADITSDFFVDTVNNTVHYPGYAPGAEPPEADWPAPVQTGQRLVVYRELPVTQEKDLGDKWPFYVIELGLDKLTMILQQIFDWWGRTLKVSRGAALDGFDLSINPVAGEVITVNGDADGFECREAMMEVNGAWDGEGRQIHDVADPSADQDAATKEYVDSYGDTNFMKLQADGTAWESRNLPVRNVGGPVSVTDAATKDYVDRILNAWVPVGDARMVPFDTADQMMDAALEVGQIAVTMGYHDINDHGAGVYNIREKTGADVIDNGFLIELTQDPSLVAELITDGTVNVKQFGAYGDGVTDDYSVLQAILTDKSPCNIVFPYGTYLVSNKLVIPGGLKVPLINLDNSTIKASDDFTDDYVIQVGKADESGTHFRETRRKHGIYNGNIEANDRTSGIYILNAESMYIHNVCIFDCVLYGLRSSKSVQLSMDSNFFNVLVTEKINNDVPDTIGFYIESHDSNYYGLRTAGFQYGFKITGSANIFIETHPFYSYLYGDPTLYPDTVGIEVTGNSNQFTNLYADNYCTGIKISGKTNIVKNYFYYVYYNNTDKAYAIELGNTTNLIDGINYSFPANRDGRILANYLSGPYGLPKNCIRNIKFDDKNCGLIKYGLDFAWNTTLNGDAKQNYYHRFDNVALAAGTAVPLFVRMQSLSGSARFSLRIDQTCRYDVILDIDDIKSRFQYEGTNASSDDGTLRLSYVTIGGNYYFVVSYIPSSAVSTIEVELMSDECIPIVGYKDKITPITGDTTVIDTQLSVISGASSPTGITANGSFFKFNGKENYRNNITFTTNQTKNSGESITLVTDLNIPQSYFLAMVYHNGNSQVTRVNITASGTLSILLPFAIDSQYVTIIKLI